MSLYQFHHQSVTEFDALQVVFTWFGKIPPSGDFWWLLWLLTLASLNSNFSDYSLVVILAYSTI